MEKTRKVAYFKLEATMKKFLLTLVFTVGPGDKGGDSTGTDTGGGTSNPGPQ